MVELLMSRSMARKMIPAVFTLAAITLLLPLAAFAARPLVTDDTGTLGKGKFQLELGYEGSDRRTDEEGVVTKEDGTNVSATVSYGVLDNLDLLLGIPYQKTKVREDDETVLDENGLSDMTLEAKWRFFEKNGFSVGLKPGVSFPTGNDKKGLGSGSVAYGAVFLVTKELEPFAFHLNAGYKRNENEVDERKDIWIANLAGEVRVAKPLKLVANIGTETNTDRQSSTAPAFLLGGLIYSITDKIDLDLGYKRGLNNAEMDNTYIGGLTIKF